jgi:phage shock protein PspC (stress-responsive transcriptional regulator)
MNKTIIININGIVFHIEEDAYDVLITYMNEVKQHFGNSTDSYEIVNDIENRLAEMFSEKLSASGKEVIVLAEVEEVTAQMGKPSDFDLADEAAFEPVAGNRTERKLFRDTDDRIIGGVCAGIGHYFDLEPRWIRVLFLVSFLVFGSGLFLYLLLWIVMPKATTRADKMAMKGEAPNLQNFKKSFDEEMQAVKENFGKAQQEVQPFLQRLGRFIEQLFSHLGKFLQGTGKVLLKLAGVFIISFGIIVLFGLFVALLALLGIWTGEGFEVFPFTIVNPEYQVILYTSAFMVVLIPLVSLILLAIRVLFNRPSLNRNISFGLLIIWLVALSTGLYYGFKTGGEFKEEARFTESIPLNPYPVYYLSLNDEKYLSHEDSLAYGLKAENFRGRIIINGDDSDMPENFELSIEKGEGKQPEMLLEYQANGKTFQKALASAKEIKYRFIQKDSILQFDPESYTKSGALWRNQRVKVILKVPENTRLIINARLNNYLNNYNLYDCLPDVSNRENLDGEWIMKTEGLSCKNDSLFKANQFK